MTLKRRNFLIFFGASVGGAVLGSATKTNSMIEASPNSIAVTGNSLVFNPIKLPLPLDIDGMNTREQQSAYSNYETLDELVLPEGFTYDVIGAWGDRLGESRFGYNNDYLALVETGPNEGFLTINFEYISGKTWMQTYPTVIGKSLPFAEVKTAAAASEGKINAFALPENDPLKARIKEIAKEGLIDQGIGIISLRRRLDGKWERTYSAADRRISGISGLEDGKYLSATGPATAVFAKQDKKGYDDGLGSKIIGTFQNCAGGRTPWGTVLSAEENFQDQVPEPVMADGSSLDPAKTPFLINDEDLDGRANVFGLAGNKYGWMVEVDPANPNDWGTKHTWLGRFRHEAVGLRALPGKKLAVYSGCDRRGGHLYKFVSRGTIGQIKDKHNSRLLEDGMLYGAKFNPDGTGNWIALNPDTAIDPVLPDRVEGKDGKGMVPLPNPDRSAGGILKVTSDADAAAFMQKFKTLGDLYEGNPTEKQGAILIDAHYAANAAGVTCTARPEDTEVAPDGTVYVTFTSGSPGSDGGPDKNIFKGPNGESPYEYGWIARLREDNSDPAAMTFRWEILALGGEPAKGGFGFSNPDNLEIDRAGNLWLFTDISTNSTNQAFSSRLKDNQAISQSDLLGLFGNNTAWYLPLHGTNAGNAYPFAIGPMDSEMTGPCFSVDRKTLFLSIQHPGEKNGMRQNMNSQELEFAMLTTNGEEFIQKRRVPVGSNWPGKKTQDPPRPAVVVIRRLDANPIV